MAAVRGEGQPLSVTARCADPIGVDGRSVTSVLFSRDRFVPCDGFEDHSRAGPLLVSEDITSDRVDLGNGGLRGDVDEL